MSMAFAAEQRARGGRRKNKEICRASLPLHGLHPQFIERSSVHEIVQDLTRISLGAPDMNADAPFIGAPIERLEDLRLLRGKGTFIDDISREGMVHAADSAQQCGHGILRSVDVSEAQKTPAWSRS